MNVLATLRPHLTYANVIATIALLAGVGGGAYAATSLVGSDGRISACVNKRTGVVRIVKPGAKCSRKERRLVWNQRGRTGRTGASGLAGAEGPAGREGAAGVPGQAGAPAASMVLGSTNVPLGTVPNLAQNIFPPSGYLPSGTTADPNIFAATTPNLPVVLRDLRVEIATAPGAGTSRTFDLINIATLQPIISCTITGSNSQCDSGGSAATLPIGTDYLMRVTNGPLAPASASWTRWAFRATTP